jgi:hypothetical protein
MEPRNRFQGMNSASLCSLAGRYYNPIPTRFLVPIDCLKIPAQYVYLYTQLGLNSPKGQNRVKQSQLSSVVFAHLLGWVGGGGQQLKRTKRRCSVCGYASSYIPYCTLIKKKIKFSSYIRKFRVEQMQSRIWLTASSYMVKYLRISSNIRKPFLIYDFAPDPIIISL